MMDAELVWDTWRRILSDDKLVEYVLHPDQATSMELTGLTPGEIAILADYASTHVATDTNIAMYRQGLVRNALAALSLVPLTRHLFYMSGIDIEATAAAFALSNGYFDYGPNFWTIAGGFIAYLARLPEFSAPVMQEVINLDTATIALAQRLGKSAPKVWPETAATNYSYMGPGASSESGYLVANRAGIVVSSNYDLTEWIENSEEFDTNADLEPSKRHWLIYFASENAAPEYAELSQRTARAFDFLSLPKTVAELSYLLGGLSVAEVVVVVASLVEMGLIVKVEDNSSLRFRDNILYKGLQEEPIVVDGTHATGAGGITHRDQLMDTLPDDAFVMLDPAVEILEYDLDGYRLLCHCHAEMGMVVPPGEGLLEFVAALMEKPVQLGKLRGAFDNQQLIETLLYSLRMQGFMHVTSGVAPSTEELAHLRNTAGQKHNRILRQFIVIDLDSLSSIEHLCARLNTGENAPEALLCCVRLQEHKLTLAELARLRQEGKVRMHNTVVQTAVLTNDQEICQSLLHLSAAVRQVGVAWPAPDRCLPGLEEMTRHCVAVHAMMKPDLSILDPTVRAQVVAWARSNFISGLCLQLEADALWPADVVTADLTDRHFLGVFNAVRAIEEEIGDVMIATLPNDEVLLGKMEPSPHTGELSALTERFRAAYMRWRIPLLKSFEGENSWSQTPEAEEKLVRPEEDLLPNHPELLQLRPGSLVVDVCGGLGRVARRLAPAVGQQGLVISIEMLRCLSDRARHFACQKHVTNVHFRPGLAQRIPLPDSTVDAAVNEWTGGIWELGLGPAMIKEMTRVVRSGGRLAVTHRLVRIPLTQLGRLWVQYEEIYSWMRDAFLHPELTILTERIWGQIVPTLIGENATLWRRQYMPRLINPHNMIYDSEESPGAHADVFLTIVAQRQ